MSSMIHSTLSHTRILVGNIGFAGRAVVNIQVISHCMTERAVCDMRTPWAYMSSHQRRVKWNRSQS